MSTVNPYAPPTARVDDVSKKGQRIFAPDYPAIVAATPDVKYRTSPVVWIVLGVLALLIVGGVLVGRFS